MLSNTLKLKFRYLKSIQILHSQYHPKSNSTFSRSSRLEVSCRKGVLRNFTKFTGKHLCQNLFFNKVADIRPTNLLEMRL